MDFDPLEHTREIVQYKGGGYPGCIWEWNFAFIDDEGEFHNLFSSGRNGAETLEQLSERLSGKTSRSPSVYFYNVDNKEDILEFADENSGFVVTDLIPELRELGIEVWASCNGWNCEFKPGQATYVHQTGRTSGDLYCDECHAQGSICELCGDSHTGFDPDIFERPSKVDIVEYPNLCHSCHGLLEDVERAFDELDADLMYYKENVDPHILDKFASGITIKFDKDGVWFKADNGALHLRLDDDILYAENFYNEKIKVFEAWDGDLLEQVLLDHLDGDHYIPDPDDYCGRLI